MAVGLGVRVERGVRVGNGVRVGSGVDVGARVAVGVSVGKIPAERRPFPTAVTVIWKPQQSSKSASSRMRTFVLTRPRASFLFQAALTGQSTMLIQPRLGAWRLLIKHSVDDPPAARGAGAQEITQGAARLRVEGEGTRGEFEFVKQPSLFWHSWPALRGRSRASF